MLHDDTKHNLPAGFYKAKNLADADLFEDNWLDHLGKRLLQGVESDIESRREWLERNDKWMELVTQVLQEKTYPWPNASNVKFPLISTAAIQFHARAFPALLGHNKPVQARVVGHDPKNLKSARARRVSTLLSYQVTEQMDNWIDDMDRLLFLVPIIGSLYKKTYYSEQKKRSCSDLIHPRDFIIGYDSNDLNGRKTHRLWQTPNTIKEFELRGLYREIPDEVWESTKTKSETKDKIQGLQNPHDNDEFTLQEIYETHCLLDLDNDGYLEPYVATIRASDGKIRRLVANYGDGDIEMEGNTLVAIKPKDYFTHYFFLPDPESKTHGIGFGTMIGPINEAVNTIINQLTDSGHLHSLGGGFLSRGIRVKGGAVKFKPSEWKVVQSTGDDLNKGIVPLPTKEPSNVLFQMLGMLIDAGKDLSSVQDQMVGRTPGQNTPYATTQAVMEQGMKVFNGIYKRLYRSMSSEFKKLYRLNREFPDVSTYMNVLDMDGQNVDAAIGMNSPVTNQRMGVGGILEYLAKDFAANDIDIIPTAEPDMVAEIDKAMKANGLIQKLQAGMPINPMEVTKRVLEAEGHENPEVLMQMPKKQPPFEERQWQIEFQHQQKMDAMKLELQRITDQADVNLKNMQAQLAMAEGQEKRIDGLHAQWLSQRAQTQEEYDSVTKRLKVMTDAKGRREAAKQNSGDTGNSESGGAPAVGDESL
jgi:chaperonin GroES